jgi:hypothetical protein
MLESRRHRFQGFLQQLTDCFEAFENEGQTAALIKPDQIKADFHRPDGKPYEVIDLDAPATITDRSLSRTSSVSSRPQTPVPSQTPGRRESQHPQTPVTNAVNGSARRAETPATNGRTPDKAQENVSTRPLRIITSTADLATTRL